MFDPVAAVRLLGGVAARRELMAIGQPVEWIETYYRNGRIERVRNGWYCVPEMPDDVKRAWRVGGRLACVSAAIRHGAEIPRIPGLHVVVSRRSAGLRNPDDRRRRLEERGRSGVVLHWDDERSMEEIPAGERQLVSLDGAIEQLVRCEFARPAATFMLDRGL
jgi:hypothetical protein